MVCGTIDQRLWEVGRSRCWEMYDQRSVAFKSHYISTSCIPPPPHRHQPKGRGRCNAYQRDDVVLEVNVERSSSVTLFLMIHSKVTERHLLPKILSFPPKTTDASWSSVNSLWEREKNLGGTSWRESMVDVSSFFISGHVDGR